VSAPQIATTLSDRGQITGLENVEEAKMLALQLRTGSLPAEIDIEENLKVGPSLSGASIQMGWRAAIVGLAAVVLFMGIYYRLSGVFAVVALGINMVLILGALAAAGATLTLPGIAGIILTIGMAVDANVLIFERIREELGAAKKIKAAIDAGYHKALRTILDANITTLITAAVLFFLGTGPVRGFAVTLSIGICTSVFAALVVTRVLFDLLLLNKSVATLKMFRFFEQPKIDFVSVRRIAITGSAVLIAFGLFAFGWGGSENFGIDFTGGSQYRFEFKEPVDTTKVRDALRELGVHNARVQEFDVPASGEVRKVLVQVRESANYDMTLDGAETEAAVRAALEKINVDPNRIRRINTAVEGTTTISFQLPGEAQTDLPAKLAQALGATLTKQQVQPTATEAPAAGEGPPATTATYTITVDGVVTADDVRAKLLGLEVAESDIAQLAATPSGQTHLTMELRGAPRGTLMPELADALGCSMARPRASSAICRTTSRSTSARSRTGRSTASRNRSRARWRARRSWPSCWPCAASWSTSRGASSSSSPWAPSSPCSTTCSSRSAASPGSSSWPEGRSTRRRSPPS
jgi:protein-export SecD/SecF family membrane protein